MFGKKGNQSSISPPSYHRQPGNLKRPLLLTEFWYFCIIPPPIPMQLHEQTQRFILLLIFYLFGPILTLGIIGGIVARKHSSNARSWERSLTQQTGLHWKIQSVEYRAPGYTRLHEVKILDDTAQSTLFSAQKVDIQLVVDTARTEIFPGILAPAESQKTGLTALLTKTFPTINSNDRYWQVSIPMSFLVLAKQFGENSALPPQNMPCQNMLHKLFSRFNTLSDVPVQLNLEQVVVVSEYSLNKPGDKTEDKVDIFRYVQGNIYRTPKEMRSDWVFHIKDVSELDWKHRERLSFVLSHSGTLEITFHTGRQPIPCGLAAMFCASFQPFFGGSFQGEFSISTLGNNTRTIRLHNVVFTKVPLAPLVGPYTDFAVEGTIADLQFAKAVFGTGETYAEGCLQVQDGTIDKALFHRCVDRFQLTVKPDSILDSSIQNVPFTACVIHFRLQPEGIDFWADELWRRDTFMYHQENASDEYAMIAYLPTPRKTVTYHELMSIFVADGAPVVPLNSGLLPLLPYVPMQ